MAGTQEVGAASLICPSCPLCLSSSPRFLCRTPHPLSLLPSAPPPAYAPVLGTCPRPPVCLAVCGLMGDTDEPASSPLGAPPSCQGEACGSSVQRMAVTCALVDSLGVGGHCRGHRVGAQRSGVRPAALVPPGASFPCDTQPAWLLP